MNLIRNFSPLQKTKFLQRNFTASVKSISKSSSKLFIMFLLINKNKIKPFSRFSFQYFSNSFFFSNQLADICEICANVKKLQFSLENKRCLEDLTGTINQ